MSKSNLLPCPFCSGEAHEHEFSWHASQFAGHMFANPYWQVICSECRAAIGDFDTRAEAIEAWNTRTCGQCEYGAVPMTEENMAAHGWFTREDVEGAFVSGYSLGSMPIGSDPRWNENEQTVDEHMAELGWVRERTCHVVGTICYDGWTTAQDSLYYHELSCGHEVETLGKEPPNFCPNCGAEVMDA